MQIAAPPVIAVLVNWNLPQDTLDCVASLRHSTPFAPQIVVVDNGSNPQCKEQLRRSAGDYHLLDLPQNLGFAAGANRGIAEALQQGAEYVLLINNDTLVAPEMLARLVAEAQATDCGIVAPLILYAGAPDTIWWLGDRERSWLPIPRSLCRDAPSASAPSMPIDVDYVTGCAMLLSRTLLEQLGGFDERFMMYYEDADLCRRARQRGFRIRAVPAARMWHKVSLSARMNRPATAFLWARSRVLFYRDGVQGMRKVLVDGFLLASGLRRIVAALAHGERELARALVRGMAAGYTARLTRADQRI